MSKKTLALVNEVATVSYNEGSKISLQSSSSTTANYIWSNAAVSGNDVDKLLDSDKNTFFHSQWNNSTAPADGWGHHISVDLGTGNTLASFKFKFTTRNTSNLSNYPKTIEIYGSNVGGDDVAPQLQRNIDDALGGLYLADVFVRTGKTVTAQIAANGADHQAAVG